MTMRLCAFGAALALVVGMQSGVQASDDELDATAGVFWRFSLQKDLQIDRSKDPEFGFNIGSQNIEKYRNQVTFHSALRPRERGGWEALSLQFDDSGLPAISLSGQDELEQFSRGLEVGGALGGSLADDQAAAAPEFGLGSARRLNLNLAPALSAHGTAATTGRTYGAGITFQRKPVDAGQ